MSRRSILIIAAMPPPVHGQSLATVGIIKELGKRNVTFTVSDTSPRSFSRKDVFYHLRRLSGHIIAWSILLSNIFTRKNKIIYTVYESGAGSIYNMVTVILAKLIGIKILLHHHTSRHCFTKSKGFDILAWVSSGQATHITLSQSMSHALTERYAIPHQDILVLNNSILIEPKHIEQSLPVSFSHGKVHLGMLANLSPEKGVLHIRSVLDSLTKNNISFYFTLAGPLVDDIAKAEVEALSIDYKGNFSYIGAISSEKKNIFFSAIDIFIFPSIYVYEAQPLVLLEALQAGVPVVASNVGFIPDMLEGSPFPCVQIDDFSEVVTTFIRFWFEQPVQLSNAAIELFENHLSSSNRQLERLVSLFNDASPENKVHSG